MTSIGESLTKAIRRRPFPAHVVQVRAYQHQVVIDRGNEDGVQVGQRFLILGLGDEIKDPETGENLGRLEIPRGTGVAIHVQEKITTIESTRKRAGAQKIVRQVPQGSRLYTVFGPTETVTSETEDLPFDSPEEGDLAKPV